MKKKTILSPSYFFSVLFILTWWGLALHSRDHLAIKKDKPVHKDYAGDNPLITLDRETIHSALHGDIELIYQLLTQWDAIARTLKNQGAYDIHRLSEEKFCRACRLYHQIKTHPKIADGRFIPQTFVSASFLLALTPTENIVAIPKAMRRYFHLYPTDKMDKISIDMDGFNTELIASLKPDLAFIASYSHPSTVQTLKNQGIRLVNLPDISKLEDIIDSLLNVGQACGEKERAELLAIFIEGAILAVDNQLITWQRSGHCLPKRPLYLTHVMHFSLPTQKSLQASLLERLNVNQSLIPDAPTWYQPIDLESIARYNPDCLLISCRAADSMEQLILSSAALRETLAAKTNKIFSLDEETQNAPCQYLVLAYYDLANALMNGGDL